MRLLRILLGLHILLAGDLAGALPNVPAASRAALPAPALTAEDAAAFFDGLIPYALQQADIPGATLVLVKDGRILLAKGYGYADPRIKTPVDPAETLFRPGSVSKLFTWTAVMQLVEQGRLDLDRDVNAYLDFRIPATFEKPITMRHLMTHTAGFEERLRDFFVRDPAKLRPMGEALKIGMPARIFPPGTVPAYSNYGAGLAAYIVQRVSGEPFAHYVRAHIFEPLGMTSSSMEQPLPPPLAKRLAVAYPASTGGEPQWYEYIQWPGAGAASMTAPDMARFMIAHLQGGRFGNVRLLRPETAALMHARQFSMAPGRLTNGLSLGFYSDDRNGHHVLAHGGATISFKSDMRLMPDRNVGLFVMLSGAGRDGDNEAVRAAIVDGFMNRYFPGATPGAEAGRPPLRRLTDLSGNYLPSRRIEGDFFRFGALLGQSAVTVFDDGTMEIDSISDAGGRPRRWREIARDAWREVGGSLRLAVRRDGQGRVQYIATDINPTVVLQPVPASLNAGWNVPLLMASITILGAATLLWPIAVFLRRRAARPAVGASSRASLIVYLTAVLNLAFIAFWFWLFASLVTLLPRLNAELDPWLRLVQLGGLIALAGTIYTTVHALRLWRRGAAGLWTRLGTTAVALACLDIAWVGVVGRLLWLAY